MRITTELIMSPAFTTLCRMAKQEGPYECYDVFADDYGLQLLRMESEHGAFLLYDPARRDQVVVVCSPMAMPDDYLSAAYYTKGLRIGLMEYSDIQALVEDGFTLQGTELIGEVSEAVMWSPL